ncbi:MAG: toxin [Proteobacteria bacterium]|nr:toxin [Pseudomonadota bacterium]
MTEIATAGGNGDRGSNSETSPFSVPSINLPKGGGAIRGVDEKFTTNPVTGSGSLSIPFPISPGRSGFGPQLSLNYDSSAGNGVFGMGWNLLLPAITRRTDKGIPQYRDNDESDIFILSGAEDLVPILCKNPKGKWIPDEFERDGYRVKRYRPRIEGLFARIEHWTCLKSSKSHWRSISKDNVLTVYGFDANSRIADPENPKHVFTWLICRSYDGKGNAILYDYAAENDDGVDLSKSNERNRIRSANRYPKRIRYGNRSPVLFDSDRPSFRRSHLDPHDLDSARWMFEVVFDYGDGHYFEKPPDNQGRILTKAKPEASHPWPVRHDPFSSYRSGFEIRTYRLCRRVLMFHHFPEELSTESYLVRSTALRYHEKPIGSFITQVIQSGHKLLDDGNYLTKQLPPLDFTYTTSPLENPEFQDYQLQTIDEDSLKNLPGGIDGGNYRWVDLDGEGISGVLAEQGDSWFYKPNLGNGRFGITETIKTRPSIAALNEGVTTLMDVEGDGNLDLVDLSPSLAGFQERALDADWLGFRAFPFMPVRNWNDPNLRFVDLTGDGTADVLVTEDFALIWHPSLRKDGFGSGIRVHVPTDDDKGLRIVFADGEQSIYLADMSGDGLSDLVRIRNREICYWPNLGYGRFGTKITMDHAPRFDEPDQFDQSRIRLADIDGSGTSDILYLGRDGIRIYLNETGNGWSSARHLQHFPAVDNVGSITVEDLLGRGTACLLWSSPLPREGGRQLRYVDLMCGQKPHLLVSAVNNLGAETRIEYASSTEFYLADKAAGTPWVTRLPFPVHVVKRVETYDYVSRNRFVTAYTYHHGFYDGVEREFRGFGRVDQLDTEEFGVLSASGNFPIGGNIEAASHVPPVLTKTWFHTGVYLQSGRISRHLAHEYYQEGSGITGETPLSPEQVEAMLLDDTILPEHLTPEEAREACRSLKGAALRQEVYGLDGKKESARPYTITESNYTIRILQRQRSNRYAVFFTHAREAITFNYERKLYEIDHCLRADPRVSHGVTLEVDDYGNVLKSVAIGYGRRFPDCSPLLTDADRKKQARILLILTENRYTNAVNQPDAYRTPLPAESKQFELIHVHPSAKVCGITNLFRFQELVEKAVSASDGAHDIPYEDIHAALATQQHSYRRLIEHVRSLYRRNDLTGPLPPARLQSLALPYESYKLALTPGLIREVYGDRVTDGMLEAEGRYVHSEGDPNWWIPSGRIFLSPESTDTVAQELAYAMQHFFLPHRYRNPFYTEETPAESFVRYDTYDLLMQETRDVLGNRVTVGERDIGGNLTKTGNDYRVLQPRLMMDPNRNRTEVAFDTLGMVVGTAVMGKPEENLGDTLAGFEADLNEAAILNHLANPLDDPHSILNRATTRLVYDQFAYLRTRNKPNPQSAVVYTLVRETHDADLAEGQQTKIQHSFSYSDGFGREIQKKIQAEPGPVPKRDTNGQIIIGANGQPEMTAANTSPRWVGSGWTVFNNKGKPVRQYEPFFTDIHRFEFDVKAGVSPVLFYDPAERVVAILNPNHTWQKVIFDPWRQESWDVNDTALIADPKNDPDVGDFFKRLPDADYLPTWYGLRTGAANAVAFAAQYPAAQDRDNETQAARKTELHAATPGMAHADALGRSFLTIAHNRFKFSNANTADPPQEEFYAIRVNVDIEGNQREVIDAKDRIVMRYDYDMLGTRIHQASMEAGERWLLNDAMGKPLYAWDSRDHRFRTAYDALRRPIGTYLREGSDAEMQIGRSVYGENQPNPEATNLRGKVYQVFDQAGVVTTDGYDFKGNLTHSSRTLADNYKTTIDWQTGIVQSTWETFSSSTDYDALNRPLAVTAPDSSIYLPGFNEANLLETVDVKLRGSATATRFVNNIDYDAKGQRQLIEYGNHTRTHYDYDPTTFRLIRLNTQRSGDNAVLQDLHYSYDPAGNITFIRDTAQQTLFFNNQIVEPSTGYLYDAVYRLIEATGREHLGQAGGAPFPHSYNDAPRAGLLQPGDGNAMGNYLERYVYDAAGNFLEFQHRGTNPANPGWTRSYGYREPSLLEATQHSNRLSSTTIQSSNGNPIIEPYGYDAHGNMLHMPQLQVMQWDFHDQLQMSQRQKVNAEDADGIVHQGERTWYVYDGAGQRVRKVTERQNGTRLKERIYTGGFEVYREYGGDGVEIRLARECLQVMDDKQRIALVETRTDTPVPEQLIRYQFGNHLGSASLELDAAGQLISYEEYFPYGSTAYQAGRSQAEVSLKRYRYTGMERDEESGLNYHSARYYATWLGRWVSCDPIFLSYGLNLYDYTHNNSIRNIDINGKQPGSIWDRILDKIRRATFVIGTLIQGDPTLHLPPGTEPSGPKGIGIEANAEDEIHANTLSKNRPGSVGSPPSPDPPEDMRGETVRNEQHIQGEVIHEDNGDIMGHRTRGADESFHSDNGDIRGYRIRGSEEASGDPWADSPERSPTQLAERGTGAAGGDAPSPSGLGEVGGGSPSPSGSPVGGGVGRGLGLLVAGLKVLGVALAVKGVIDDVKEKDYFGAILNAISIKSLPIAILSGTYHIQKAEAMAYGAILQAGVDSAKMYSLYIQDQVTPQQVIESHVDLSDWPRADRLEVMNRYMNGE